jgi:proline iminopeptidase
MELARPLIRSRLPVRPILASMLCGAVLMATTRSQAEDGSFVSGGHHLSYRSLGTGPPAIILSGGPGFVVDYMLPVADALPRHRKILLEQRGTGRSRGAKPTPADMTLKVAVRDLETLREHLKEERLFLVGHSWGGMLAMAYAAAHPDRIDRLILIDSGGPTLEFAGWFDDNIRARMRPEDAAAERYWGDAAKHGMPAEKVALESARAVTPAYFFDRGKGLAFAAQLTDDSLHSDVNAMLFADLEKGYDVRTGLRTLDRPTLIVHGHQDPIGDKTAEDIHSLIKSSTLVYLDKCGHFPWLEQPEAFRRAIGDFLDGAAPDKRSDGPRQR